MEFSELLPDKSGRPGFRIFGPRDLLRTIMGPNLGNIGWALDQVRRLGGQTDRKTSGVLSVRLPVGNFEREFVGRFGVIRSFQ